MPYYFERFNATIVDLIATSVSNVEDWDEQLLPATHAYNATALPVLGVSPYELVFGIRPKLPVDLVLGSYVADVSLADFAITKLENTINTMNIVKQRLNQSAGSRNMLPVHNFVINDKVLVKIQKRSKQGKRKKFSDRFKGPFIVDSFVNETVVKLKFPDGRYYDVVHTKHLKPYHELEDPIGDTTTEKETKERKQEKRKPVYYNEHELDKEEYEDIPELVDSSPDFSPDAHRRSTRTRTRPNFDNSIDWAWLEDYDVLEEGDVIYS